MKPFRCVTAWLLFLILIVPAEARERTPQEQAKRIAPCSRVVVELKSGRSYFGQLGEVTDTKLVLEPQPRELMFQDISRIRSVEPKPVWLRTLEAPVLIPFRVLEATVLIVVCVTTAPFGGGCDE